VTRTTGALLRVRGPALGCAPGRAKCSVVDVTSRRQSHRSRPDGAPALRLSHPFYESSSLVKKIFEIDVFMLNFPPGETESSSAGTQLDKGLGRRCAEGASSPRRKRRASLCAVAFAPSRPPSGHRAMPAKIHQRPFRTRPFRHAPRVVPVGNPLLLSEHQLAPPPMGSSSWLRLPIYERAVEAQGVFERPSAARDYGFGFQAANDNQRPRT